VCRLFYVKGHYVENNVYLCGRKNDKTMARPIKETPILFGEDAQRFEERMKEKRHLTPEEKAELMEAYLACLAMLERGKRRKHAEAPV
jgi:hypothetical protein